MEEITAIYQEFRQSLFSYIRGKVRTKEDAEDILQTVFLKISMNLHSLSGKEKLKDWIFTITRNTVYDYYRQKNRNKMIRLPDSIPDLPDAKEPPAPAQRLEQCLQGFIQQLPEKYQKIIEESELKGIKQKELAIQYKLPYSSLRSQVQRGRDRLKQMLLQCCQLELDSRGSAFIPEGKASCKQDYCKSCE